MPLLGFAVRLSHGALLRWKPPRPASATTRPLLVAAVLWTSSRRYPKVCYYRVKPRQNDVLRVDVSINNSELVRVRQRVKRLAIVVSRSAVIIHFNDTGRPSGFPERKYCPGEPFADSDLGFPPTLSPNEGVVRFPPDGVVSPPLFSP